MLAWTRPRVITFCALALIALLIWIRMSPAPEYLPTADLAVIELYTLHATEGRALLGPYSRFGWNHPGPMYFYVLAPIYAFGQFKTSALFAGAAAVNVIAVVLALGLAVRAGNRSFAALLALGVLVYAIRAPEALASPWNPHVIVLPVIAFLVAASSVVAENARLLPLLGALGTFLVQTHIGTLPTVAAVTMVALVSVIRPSAGKRAPVRSLALTAVVVVALWWPPLVQQFSDPAGNITRIGRFFAQPPGSLQPVNRAIALWTDLFTNSLRPGFRVPWGAPLYPPYSILPIVVSCGVVSLIVIGLWQSRRNGDRFAFSLGVVLLVAVVASSWSATRVVGDLWHYVIFWITGLGIVSAAFAVHVVVHAFGLRRPAVRFWSLATNGIEIAVLAAILAQVQSALENPHRRMPDGLTALRMMQALTEFRAVNPRLGKPLMRMSAESWHVAAGLVLQMQKTGMPIAVERSSVWMFSDSVAPDGNETWSVTVARGAVAHELVAQGTQQLVVQRAGFFMFADPNAPRFEHR